LFRPLPESGWGVIGNLLLLCWLLPRFHRTGRDQGPVAPAPGRQLPPLEGSDGEMFDLGAAGAEIQGHLDTVTGLERLGDLESHQMVTTGLQHDRLPGGDGQEIYPAHAHHAIIMAVFVDFEPADALGTGGSQRTILRAGIGQSEKTRSPGLPRNAFTKIGIANDKPSGPDLGRNQRAHRQQKTGCQYSHGKLLYGGNYSMATAGLDFNSTARTIGTPLFPELRLEDPVDLVHRLPVDLHPARRRSPRHAR